MSPKLSCAALALALVVSHPAKTASSEPDLATVRAATARFQDVKQAIAWVRDHAAEVQCSARRTQRIHLTSAEMRQQRHHREGRRRRER